MSFKEQIITYLSSGALRELLTFELVVGRSANSASEADTFMVDIAQLRRRGVVSWQFEGCDDPCDPYYFDVELTAYGLLVCGRSLFAG